MYKRKRAALILAALMCISIFTGAIDASPRRVVILLDGKEMVYQTSADNVGDFLITSGIRLKDNDYLSHTDVSPVYDNMIIVIKVAKYITVFDDGQSYAAVTYAPTVREVMEDFSNPLSEADIVTPAPEERAYDGMTISVTRSKTVEFSRDGSTIMIHTYAKTVEEFMREKKLYPSAMQNVSPAPETPVADGMKIEFLNNKPRALSPLNFGVTLVGARSVICTATAYTSAADETWPYSDGYTATGAKCEVGVVAVDPKVIPLGSRLFIETTDGSFVYGFCMAADTGGAIKGHRVDLAMNTKTECYNFGRRLVKVYILP